MQVKMWEKHTVKNAVIIMIIIQGMYICARMFFLFIIDYTAPEK